MRCPVIHGQLEVELLLLCIEKSLLKRLRCLKVSAFWTAPSGGFPGIFFWQERDSVSNLVWERLEPQVPEEPGECLGFVSWISYLCHLTTYKWIKMNVWI